MPRSDLTNPADRLPDLTLVRAGGGEERLRARHRRPVLLFVHPWRCAWCEAYVGSLEAATAGLRTSGGVVRLVVPHTDYTGPIPVLLDPGDRARSALRVEPPAVVLADEWGEVHLRRAGGDDHALPPVRELVEWVEHLAIRCQECEAPARLLSDLRSFRHYPATGVNLTYFDPERRAGVLNVPRLFAIALRGLRITMAFF